MDVLQELKRKEVEEQMRNEHAVGVLAGLGVRYKTAPPNHSRAAVDEWLAPKSSADRRPKGAAAAAAQDAWDTL